jgi:16S rRNA (uracil1498-N3)-methyltransferase
MQIFYTPDITGVEYILTEEESKHAVRVLRLAAGEKIFLVDGKGIFFEGVIADPHPKRCLVIVQNIIKDYGKRNYKLHIAMSPLKNPERFEWFLEKCTEIGIDTVTPLLCARTERKIVNIERCYRIAESAMKQSIKAYRPEIRELTKFSDLIQNSTEKTKLIACCEGNRQKISEIYTANEEVLILIGPEGDFSPQEVELAVSNGFKSVTLGQSRLRTETAGVAACHSIAFMNL